MTSAAIGQNLGHRIPGLLGLDAARIPEPGLYLIDRLALYRANELRDADGNLLFAGKFNFQGNANGIGVSYTTKVSGRPMFLSMTVGVPIARAKLSIQDFFQADIDQFGLGDYYIEPIKLGWRRERSEVVTSYGIYLPSGRSALAGGKGISSGQITNEFSGGGSLYFKDRTRFLTALASYQLYTRQRGIDIKRGDTVQIEGGAGVKFLGQTAETGIASYAFWQVRDHSGTELPAVLRTARDRVFGLGPEAAIFIKPIRSQVRVRYEWDLGVLARPQGHIVVVDIYFLVHAPKQHAKQPSP
jgi:hypothetical protein